MTGFFDVLVALIVATFVNLFVVSRIRAGTPPGESQFLVKTYAWTLALRFAMALFLNLAVGTSRDFANTFWGDSSTYDYGGWAMAQYWDGVFYARPDVVEKVSGWGAFYAVGAIYWVFGRNQLLIQFLNATLGSLSVLVIYSIAKELFGVEEARWAARFMAFFPQMVFWSCAIYKDPAILLCIALAMYAVLRMSAAFSFRHVGLYVLACLALMSLRFYVFYIVAFATLGTFVISQRNRNVFGGLIAQIVLVGSFLAAFSFAVGRETVDQQMSYFTWERLQITREDQAHWGASAFESQADVSTPAGALATLPLGIVYLFLAPFPWSFAGLRQAIVIPEMLVWYALLPSLFRGLMLTLRTRFRPALPILVFAGALTCSYAVFQGNIGTAYRQRTQISMFFFIFMGAGIVDKQRERARLAEARARFDPVVAYRR